VPRDGAVLRSAPARVVVLFDDVVRVAPGNAAVRNGGGSVLAGKPVARGRVLTLPLRPGLARGAYSVRWSAVSQDGHVVQGVLAFGVGERAVSELQPTVSVGAGTVVSRWFFFAGLLLAGGLALFDLLVWRPVAFAHVRTGWIAVALAAMFVSAHGLVHASHGGAQTRFGLAVDVASVVAAVGAAGGALAIADRSLAWFAVVPALLVLAAPTFGGHALDPGRSWVDVPIDLLHVVAAAFWLGGLFALAVAIPRDTAAEFVTAATRRFSRFALWAVVLLALTGVGRALAELASFSQLWTTGYGRAIAVKTIVFSVALSLAWFSRNGLTWALRLETIVAVGVVVALAFLTALPPGDRHVRFGPVSDTKGGKVTTSSQKSAIAAVARSAAASASAVRTCPGVRHQRRERHGFGAKGSGFVHRPRWRAMTSRCTSFVPSPISRIFWSRYRRAIADSSM
jgi:copper transport protein